MSKDHCCGNCAAHMMRPPCGEGFGHVFDHVISADVWCIRLRKMVSPAGAGCDLWQPEFECSDRVVNTGYIDVRAGALCDPLDWPEGECVVNQW